jgi:hypothetical protein
MCTHLTTAEIASRPGTSVRYARRLAREGNLTAGPAAGPRRY